MFPRWIGLAALVCAGSVCAQEADSGRVRLWKAQEWGTESQFNPLSLVLNEGWDIGQFNGHDRRVDRLMAPKNFEMLGGTLSHPYESIRRRGTRRFLKTEVVPSSLDKSEAMWLPNLQLHLLGGGFNSARIEDWYAAHGYSNPGLLAALTTMTAATLNEAAELEGTSSHFSTDPLADMLLFDPAGILLFRCDAVRSFFAHRVEMANWPLQPSLAWPDGRVENAGQSWIVKVKTPWEKWKLFYHYGLGEVFGLTRRVGEGGLEVTAAGGLGAIRNEPTADGGTTVAIAPKLGLFLDRKNSLLATVQYHHEGADRVVLELHPSPLTSWPVPWGMWLHGGGSSGLGVGLTTRIGLGLGVVKGERSARP